VVVDADAGLDLQAPHEHGQALAAGRGGGEGGGDDGTHRPCSTMSGVRQARCWPPSTAIIWPVTPGASIRYRTAAAMSWGVARRPSGVCVASASNWAGLWWMDGRVGPGPTPLTRMRGARAWARVRVANHRPAFETA